MLEGLGQRGRVEDDKGLAEGKLLLKTLSLVGQGGNKNRVGVDAGLIDELLEKGDQGGEKRQGGGE